MQCFYRVIRYFCHEQSWSRLECSVLQKDTNEILKDITKQVLLSSNLFQNSYHQHENHM